MDGGGWYLGYVSGIVFGIIFGWVIFDGPNVKAKDQHECGEDRAIHVWKENNIRLVVCERPHGLVVREVTEDE